MNISLTPLKIPHSQRTLNDLVTGLIIGIVITEFDVILIFSKVFLQFQITLTQSVHLFGLAY